MSELKIINNLVKSGKIIYQIAETPLKRVFSVTKSIAPGLKISIIIDMDKPYKKADYAKYVKTLVDFGMSQKWASHICGIAQSYASKLLHD